MMVRILVSAHVPLRQIRFWDLEVQDFEEVLGSILNFCKSINHLRLVRGSRHDLEQSEQNI